MSEDCSEKARAVISIVGKVILNVAFPFLGSFVDAVFDGCNLNHDPQNTTKKFRYKLSRNSAIATSVPTMIGIGLMGFSAAGDFSTSSEVAKIFSLDDFDGSLSHMTGVPFLDGFILAEYLLCFVVLAMAMRGSALLVTVCQQAEEEERALLAPSGAQPVADEDFDERQPEQKSKKCCRAIAGFIPYGLFGNLVRDRSKGKTLPVDHSTTYRRWTPPAIVQSVTRPSSNFYYGTRIHTASPSLTPENFPLSTNPGSRGGSVGVIRGGRGNDEEGGRVDPRRGIYSAGARRL